MHKNPAPITTLGAMRRIRWQRPATAVVGALFALLAGCGPGYYPTITLTGTAATGAAMANATVEVVNTRGEIETTRTDAQGRYSLRVNEGAPYLLSSTDSAGNRWYSYANSLTTAANITPLTTLAVLDASGNMSLEALRQNWYRAVLSDARVTDAARRVNAHVQGLLTGAGLDPLTTNIFTHAFRPDGRGLDAVLDAMLVSLNCSASACAQSINTPGGQTLVNWNPQIPITGFNISWSANGVSVTTNEGTPIVSATTPGATTGTAGAGTAVAGAVNVSLGACSGTARAGTYSMVVRTTAAGLGTPEICIDGLEGKPTSQADFCGGAAAAGQLPPGMSVFACSWADPTGSISGSVTTAGFTVDYLVTYTFTRR